MAKEHDEARSVARSLEGSTINTLARGKPNTVLAVDDEGIMVRARTERLVTWETVDSVIDALLLDGAVRGQDLRASGVAGGFRSAFIFSLLAHTSFAAYSDGTLALTP